MSVPKRVASRIQDGLRKYQPVLKQAKAKDINEADTVQIVAGILSDLFGWDPFFEVTKEYAIRATFVDLAVKTEDAVAFLVEVKAIGADLSDNHLRQAVNYAANEGIEWVVLTNGDQWQAHRVVFGKPISHELVFEAVLTEQSTRSPSDLEKLFVLTKEGMTKSAIATLHAEQQALSRFNIAAILRSEDVAKIVRRELKRAYPSLRPTLDEITEIIEQDVLKRDLSSGQKAKEAMAVMRRASGRALRKSK